MKYAKIFITIISLGLAQVASAQKSKEVLSRVDSVELLLIKHGVQHPDIVLRQVILETGWLGSYNTKVRNNIMGWYYKGSYKTFRSWEHCVVYCKNWQTKHYHGGDYYEFLEEIGYAEDKLYVSKLKNISGI